MSATIVEFVQSAIADLQAFLWPDAREFTIPVYFDYFATFTWAVSGAILGAHRRYDLVGVFVIAPGIRGRRRAVARRHCAAADAGVPDE